jgi:flagellin-like hook-associated protein FlgL
MGLRVHANVVSIPAPQDNQPDHLRVEPRPGGGCLRLSAGLRISTAADSERLRAQIRSIANVQRDSDSAACFVQTAENALDDVGPFLSSLREITTKRSGVRARDRSGRLAESNRVLDIDAAFHTLLITDENLSTAESRIRDVAVACETARRTRDSILQRASVALLSQANALPHSAQRLLG